MLVKQLHSFRATKSFDTSKEWEDNGVTVKPEIRKGQDGKESTFFTRPEIEISVEVPTLEVLMADEKGKEVLQKMLENLAFNVMNPYVAANKDIAEYPELSDISILAKALEEKAKSVKLTATPEQMEQAAHLYTQYLLSLGKNEDIAKSQSDLFKAKFSKSRLNRFHLNLIQRGVDTEKSMEFIGRLRDNVVTFMEFLSTQDEAIIDAGSVPSQICLQSIDDWLQADREEEEDNLVSLEDF